MFGLLLVSAVCVTHPPGWSDPVVAIEVPHGLPQRNDLIVTDTEHVHQIWNKYEGDSRIGYNIVLPDGTPLFPDTMLSRDVYSTYPSCSLTGPDSGFVGFWRESTPIWYAERDQDGGQVLSPTLFASMPWQDDPNVHACPDSLGRIHMTYATSVGTCYSVLIPGVGEAFRDTIPNSTRASHLIVDGDRVHIQFEGLDYLADYIQYDLDGNVTVPTVSLVEGILPDSDNSDITVDSQGNAMVLVQECIQDNPHRLALFKIDRDTGALLIDDLNLYEPPYWYMHYPVILPAGVPDWFYIMWREDDSGGWGRLIKCAVIDSDGAFVYDPYTAYDYTDEEEDGVQWFTATVNQDGDIFAHWSEVDMSVPGYWLYLGWFDHNWLGVEEETEPAPPSDFILSASQNPFTESVTFTAYADPLPAQLAIYDITGRLIRSLGDGQGGSEFLWDGRDASGKEVPPGTYLIQGASAGRLASVRVVKL